MNRKLYIILALGLMAVLGSRALACLWPEGKHYNTSRPIELGGLDPDAYVTALTTGYQSTEYWELNLAAVSGKPPYYHFDNNVAVALIHLGRYSKAIELLEKSEQKSGKSYLTASNLGTAYELSGDNEKALKWIKEGIGRDANSHFGTEWLHIKILEAKIALKKDPNWLQRNSVLGISWDTVKATDASTIDLNGQVRSAAEIQKAIEYQLHERLEFVKPPDPTVADLLFDLSKLVERSHSPEHGPAVVTLAKEYGLVKGPIPPTTTPATTTGDNALQTKSSTAIIAGALILIATLFLIGFALVRRKFRSRIR